MNFSTEIGTDLAKAKEWLEMDEVVAVPTETVYGLAGNALSKPAVAKIFAVKNRPTFDPLIVHLKDWSEHVNYVREVGEKAYRLAEAFMPGPLTLVLPKKDSISDLVTSGSPFVAIRVPAHPMMRQLLASIDFPLAAPSANPFGYISPTSSKHVWNQLKGAIPYILEGGVSEVGLESTIVKVEAGEVMVLRKGGLPIEQIEEVVGKVEVFSHSSSNPESPGQLKSHYAPRKPLLIGDIQEMIKEIESNNVGVLSFRESYNHSKITVSEVLSRNGNLAEAAQNLFAAMRRLDASAVEVIIAEYVPEEGLGRAINDRLKRASAH